MRDSDGVATELPGDGVASSSVIGPDDAELQSIMRVMLKSSST